MLIKKFLEMLNTVKVHHWRTRAYSTHKATDELYADLNKYVDEFVEVMLGGEAPLRISLRQTHLPLFDCNNQREFEKKMQEYKAFLQKLPQPYAAESHLCNIRDEMLSTIDKALYQLTLVK